jgi:hypothetical protein
MVWKSYSGVPNVGSAAVKPRKAGQRCGPTPLCRVALDSALYLVEQRPQLTRIDAIRGHKVANDWIGQQLVD